MLQRTSRLFFWLYVATLLLVGSGGMFFAQYELATLYRLDLSSLPASASIQSGPENFLNQYRFLKANSPVNKCTRQQLKDEETYKHHVWHAIKKERHAACKYTAGNYGQKDGM